MNLSDWMQLLIAIFTAIAAVSAAYAIRINKQDREMKYKPQFEIITDEGDNTELNIANLNPNYQSYVVLSVINKTTNRELDFEKQLTRLNNGLNILKIQFNKNDRAHSKHNVIHIKFKSILDLEYEQEVSFPVDKNHRISHNIKGLTFKEVN